VTTYSYNQSPRKGTLERNSKTGGKPFRRWRDTRQSVRFDLRECRICAQSAVSGPGVDNLAFGGQSKDRDQMCLLLREFW